MENPYTILRRLSMDKKITIAIIAIIVAVVAIGAYFGLANTFIPESSPLTDLFDYSIVSNTFFKVYGFCLSLLQWFSFLSIST